MSVDLSFLAAVAVAGGAYLAGEWVVARFRLLQAYYVPGPLVGGLGMAFVFLALRGAGIPVHFPTSGYPVDFLVSLLTVNMGLHLTPRVVRQGYRFFFLFLGAALLLFCVQFLLALPHALQQPHWLAHALVVGPVSFVGAPFNLNPPAQIPPIAGLLAPAWSRPEAMAQGVMMVALLGGSLLTPLVGRHLMQQVEGDPPRQSAEDETTPRESVWFFGAQASWLIVLILILIALAFWAQDLLLRHLAGLQEGHLPVILLGYFFGAACRLTVARTPWRDRFPETALSVLLLGPTMGIVLTYALMSIPLYHVRLVSWGMVVGVLPVLAASVGAALLLFPLARRYTDSYYAATIATVFLGVTTGWGPVGMAFLHRFIDKQGKVEPMPSILPVNALYLFPWLAILMTRLLYGLFS